MKNKLILLLFPFLVLFTKCSSVKYTSFHGATKMAEVALPDSIKDLAVLNRTRANSILESGGLTNRPGVDEVLSSFKKELNRKKYFDVSTLNKVDKTDQSNNFPPALIQQELQEIFANDLLVASLEIYQVKELNEYTNEQKMQLDPDGNEYYIDIVKATRTLQARTGWRVYSSIDGNIIDEFVLDHEHAFTVEGVDRTNANAKMEERVGQAYKDLGSILGYMYAERLSPTSTYVSRKYYAKSKSCPELKQADDFIKDGDWVTAMNIWKDGLAMNTNPKDLAKLHYNIGVYYEKEDRLDKAIEQLELSTQNDSEIGSSYLNQLKAIKRNGYASTNL